MNKITEGANNGIHNSFSKSTVAIFINARNHACKNHMFVCVFVCLFNSLTYGKAKSKNSLLTFQKTPNGKEKGKNSTLTLKKKHMVWQKGRARSLLLEKKITW